MKRVNIPVVLLMLVLLTACGQAKAPSKEPVNQMPAAEELGIPATAELEYVANGTMKTVPSTLYMGEGYSLYIPDEGWRRDTEREGRIPVDAWESVLDSYTEVQVWRYGPVPLKEAVTDFLDEEDDYVFPQLILGSDEILDPMEGMDEDGEVLKFIMRTGKEGTFVVCWKYRDALGGAASQAEQMAKTFVPD